MDISVPDDNLMDVPSLLGNEKLKPIKTDDGVIWKKDGEENKNVFGCGPSVFGTPPQLQQDCLEQLLQDCLVQLLQPIYVALHLDYQRIKMSLEI